MTSFSNRPTSRTEGPSGRRSSSAKEEARNSCAYALILLLAVSWSLPVAQAQTDFQAQGETVVINAPEEIDLQVLIDYVGATLKVRFLYGEEISNKKVNLRPSPIEVPRDRLMELLASVLRVRDLALVQEDVTLFRIVAAEQAMRSVGEVGGVAPDDAGTRVVTQVLPLPAVKSTDLTDKLSRFLSSPKGSLIPVPERGMLIVTDYESRIRVIRELIETIESGVDAPQIEMIRVGGADVHQVAAHVSGILAEAHRVRDAGGQPPSVRGDLLKGYVVAVGTAGQLAEVRELIHTLTPADVDLLTRAYQPIYLSLDRAQRLIENVVLAPGSGVSPPAATHTDTESGKLFVTASAETHAAIALVLTREDDTLPQAQRPLRVYRPRYRTAAELLATLTQLLGEGLNITAIESSPESTADRSQPPGPNRPPAAPGRVQVPPTPPAQVPADPAARETSSILRVTGPGYVLTADEHTNAILAIGTREFHAQIIMLLEELDHRRPQVLIEMKLIAITMSRSRDLGVELEAFDFGEAWDFLVFSNFNLSSIDVATGQRVLTPGVGANGALISPDEESYIIRALATHADAKVVSAPRLLVADNARGTLRNVDEAPFTSVNASDTVATTSFAGFESAGTTLSVTPHISDGEHLTLEYELSFSNFSGSSSTAAVPPPRTTNSFSSVVEVPDGYTVVTGGLTVDNTSDAVSEVPWLGRLPGVGWLFQSSSQQRTKTRIYAFIKPVILRDDEFANLKHLTLHQLEDSEQDHGAHDELPEPLWMR